MMVESLEKLVFCGIIAAEYTHDDHAHDCPNSVMMSYDYASQSIPIQPSFRNESLISLKGSANSLTVHSILRSGPRRFLQKDVS